MVGGRVPTWVPWRLAFWAAAFAVALEGQLRLEDRDGMRLAAVYMGVAVLLIVAATWGLRTGEPGESEPESTLPRRWTRPAILIPGVLALVGLALGIAFRVFRLDSEPPGIWFDEALNGLIARAILNGDYPPIFIGGFTQLPSLFFYLYAGAFRLGGESILTLRSFTTVGGLLALPLVFLLGRELFGWRAGALSIFLLAVMRWHVNFSRFGVTNIWATVFALAAIYFLVRGLRGKGWWNLVLAGIFTGLGPYSGFYFTFFPLVLIAFWAHSAFSDRKLEWRKHLLAIVLVGGVAMAVYSPVGWWATQNWDAFTDRPSSASILEDKSRDEQIQAVLKSTKQHALMFNSFGDRNGRHNLPGAPMLDTFTAVFFVLGIGIAAARILRPQYFLLLVWLAIMMQSGIWSNAFEAPQAFRTSTLTPAVAMLAALPLAGLWSMAASRWESRKAMAGDDRLTIRGRSLPHASVAARYAVAGAVALTLAFFCAQIAYRNFDRYFDEQLRDASAWAAYSTGATIVANEIDDLEADTEIRLSTLFAGQPTLEFVNPDVDDSQLLFDWVLDLPSSSDRSAAYFLDETKAPFVAYLRELYPLATFRDFTPPGVPGPVVVYEILVDERDVQQIRGVQAVYVTADGDTIRTREAALDLDWSFQAPGALPLEAVWSGFVEVPAYREYTLVLELPGSARISLDGELVAEGDDRIAFTQLLYKGEHELLVEATVEDFGFVRLMENELPISREAYFAYGQGGHGLLASYYPNGSLEGPPVHVELDALVGFRYHAELPGIAVPPFSVRWQGLLDVPAAGVYFLELETFDEGAVRIDGRLQIVSGRGTTRQEVDLSEGLHEIEVTFSNRTGFSRVFLYWTPPGEERQVIPPQRFLPR